MGTEDLLAGYPLENGSAEKSPSVYAVDVTAWPRGDAESSPERGYYYHPSRHSADQPIIAGWAYQLVAEIGFAHETWVAPVDVRRVHPAEDENDIAASSTPIPRLWRRGQSDVPTATGRSSASTIPKPGLILLTSITVGPTTTARCG